MSNNEAIFCWSQKAPKDAITFFFNYKRKGQYVAMSIYECELMLDYGLHPIIKYMLEAFGKWNKFVRDKSNNSKEGSPPIIEE